MLQRLKRWFELRYGSLLSHYPDTEWELPNGDKAFIAHGRSGGVWLSIHRNAKERYPRQTGINVFYFQESAVSLRWGRPFMWQGDLFRDKNGSCNGISSIPEEVKDVLLPLLYSLPQVIKKSIDTRVEAQTKKEQQRRETLAKYVEMLKEGTDAKNV